MTKPAPYLIFLKRLNPLAIIIAALSGAILFVWLFGTAVYTLEGLSFQISLQPAWRGETILELPPLGNIAADTHEMPLTIQITLQNIETDLASNLLRGDTEKTVWHDVQTDLRSFARNFCFRQIHLAMLGATATVFIIWRWRPKMILAGVLTALLGSTLFFFCLAESYDLNAFAQPEVNGVLSLAANVFPEPDNLLQKLDEIQSRTRIMVNNIEELFASTTDLSVMANPDGEKSMRKILLVGDLHSNPIGIELISSISDAFAVDLIIDSGDLTDFGSAIETAFVQELEQIKTPYLFCPGNHDSPETTAAIQAMPQGQILEGSIIEAAGLKILGSPDPLFIQNTVTEEDQQKETGLLKSQAENLMSQAPLSPDIVVVHNPAAAQKLAGSFPLIITGHTHRQQIIKNSGSVIINPGTTGAAGIRGLYSEEETPYSAVILYIKPGEKAAAVDLIKYVPSSHNFIIERKLLKTGSQSQSPDQDTETAINSQNSAG